MKIGRKALFVFFTFHLWVIFMIIKTPRSVGDTYPVEVTLPIKPLKIRLKNLKDTTLDIPANSGFKYYIKIKKRGNIVRGDLLLVRIPVSFLKKSRRLKLDKNILPFESAYEMKWINGDTVIYKGRKMVKLPDGSYFQDTFQGDTLIISRVMRGYIEIQFKSGYKIFQKILIPGKHYSWLFLGEKEEIYKNPYIFPSYVEPFWLEEVQTAVKKGVIKFEQGRLKIDTTSKDWKNLFIKTDSGFIWKEKFYGISKNRKFDPYFLEPWVIQNGSLKGVNKYYFRQGMSEEIILGKQKLSFITDRNGIPIFKKDLSLQDSILNFVFPSNILFKILYYLNQTQNHKKIELSIDMQIQRILEESVGDFLIRYFNRNKRLKQFYTNKGKKLPPMGIVILNEKSEILAVVSLPNDGINRVWRRAYSIGSAIKPFITAVALEKEKFIKRGKNLYVPRAVSGNKNLKIIFSDPSGVIDKIGGHKLLKPIHNFKGQRFPFNITLEHMVAFSINTAACNLFMSLSPLEREKVLNIMFLDENIPLLKEEHFPEFSLYTGFHEVDFSELDQVARIAIGDKVYLSILWLTNLFRALYENNLTIPTLIKVDSPNVILDNVFKTDLSPLHKALKEVIKKGTASFAFKHKDTTLNKFIIGGKTGTAEIPNSPANKIFVTAFKFRNLIYYMGVIVENGEVFGVNAGVKIVKEFLKNLIKKEKKDEKNKRFLKRR